MLRRTTALSAKNHFRNADQSIPDYIESNFAQIGNVAIPKIKPIEVRRKTRRRRWGNLFTELRGCEASQLVMFTPDRPGKNVVDYPANQPLFRVTTHLQVTGRGF